MYYFEVNGDDIQKGDCVVVESSFGVTLGHVVTDRLPVVEEDRELKKVLRKATEKDISKREKNRELEKESKAFCLERIRARGLPMKLTCTEATLDRKRIIFYFTADGRIDFRELVKDLAAQFKTRIEMRQIGVRDETKLIGGLGPCGREVCCRTFLTSFSPVSIKMAKQQELVLNTNKLSGLCGRLMCCLGYEAEMENGRSQPTETHAEDVAVMDEVLDTSLETTVAVEPAPENGIDRDNGNGPDSPSEAEGGRANSRGGKRTGPAGAQKAEGTGHEKKTGGKRRRSRKFHRQRRKRKKKKQ